MEIVYLWVAIIGSVLIAILRLIFGFSVHPFFGATLRDSPSFELDRPHWLEISLKILEVLTFAAVTLTICSYIDSCEFSEFVKLIGMLALGLCGGLFYAMVLWDLVYFVVLMIGSLIKLFIDWITE